MVATTGVGVGCSGSSLFVLLASFLDVFTVAVADDLAIGISGGEYRGRGIAVRVSAGRSHARIARRSTAVVVIHDIRLVIGHSISNEGTTDGTDGETTSSTHEHATLAALLLSAVRVRVVTAVASIAVAAVLTTVATRATMLTAIAAVLAAVATTVTVARSTAIARSTTVARGTTVRGAVAVGTAMVTVVTEAAGAISVRVVMSGGFPLRATRCGVYVVPALVLRVELGLPTRG